MMKACTVIPSRLASTRLPRKVLADINGKPMLYYVWQQVSQAKRVSDIYIATDSEEVCSAAVGWGAQVMMTSPDCRSGTERIASILHLLPGELILNVQGDEPLIDPGLLDAMVAEWEQQGGDIITPVYPILDVADLLNPNIVKVVRTQAGRALYFSRNPIPYVRDLPVERWLEKHQFWGHAGVYGYRRDVLRAYPGLLSSPLEVAESLEQLRFLDAGYHIQTVETQYRPVAVDTHADLDRVRQILEKQT